MKIHFLTVPNDEAMWAALDAEGLFIEYEDGSRGYYGTLPNGVTLDYIGEYQKLAGYDNGGNAIFTPVVGSHINIYAPHGWELPASLTGYTKRPVTPHRLPAGFVYVQEKG